MNGVCGRVMGAGGAEADPTGGTATGDGALPPVVGGATPTIVPFSLLGPAGGAGGAPAAGRGAPGAPEAAWPG
jgi:hypothetical protein